MKALRGRPRFKYNVAFRQKLFASYLILSITPILVLGIYSYYQSKALLERQALQGIHETIQSIADNMEYKTSQYQQTMDSIVYNAGIRKIFNGEYSSLTNLSYDLKWYLEPMFDTIIGLNREIIQLTVYVQNEMPEYGNYILHSQPIEETGWYQATKESLHAQWFREQSDLILARKIPDIFKVKYPSIVYFKMNYNEVFKALQGEDMDFYGIAVKDSDSNVIYSNSTYQNGELGTSSRVMTVREPISSSGWTLYYDIPLDRVSIDARKIIQATLIIILVCFSVLTFLIWIFSRMITRPIQKLSGKMQLVEDGDLDVAVTSDSHDEFGELTNQFGRMLKKINELIKEVYQTKIDRQKIQFKALQSQINPHFLYNTLSAIRWKLMEAEEHEISEIVDALAKYYRTALNKGNHMISVREEIVNVQSYLTIMQITKKNKFDIVYSFDDKIFAYETINLILQPLVENAIQHGIIQWVERRGLIAIRGACSEGVLTFTVEDNGIGMSKERMQEVLSPLSNGYGLRNVHERLKLFFGEAYGITMDSKPGAGTVVTVRFPQSKAE